MDIRELRDALRTALPDADIPQEFPADDMYPFTFISRAFVTPFMDALVRVEVGATETDTDTDGSARARLETLAGLAERVFADGDDETVDPLAVRLVFNRLVRRPSLLAAVWPLFGPHTRAIAGKFVALEEQCRQREQAVRDQGAATEKPTGAETELVHSTDGTTGAPCP